MNLGRTQTALGAFYRRLAYRVGKAKAITATARKLAILVYRALKGDLIYEDPGASAYDAQPRNRILRRLRQRAASLGFDLLNRQTGELLDAGTVVSYNRRRRVAARHPPPSQISSSDRVPARREELRRRDLGRRPQRSGRPPGYRASLRQRPHRPL